MQKRNLFEMTRPEVERAIAAGVDTVVVPFGSTEQHGRHLPLGTDAVLGDELGWRLAERLDSFLAPTVRIGCSEQNSPLSDNPTIRQKDAPLRGEIPHV